MKKEVKSICLIMFLFVFLMTNTAEAINITGRAITGETVTGEATKPVGMNITISVFLPTLSILSPQNKTYLTNQSILFSFTKTGEQAAWYNLDNSENTTATSSLYFNTSEGSHTIYLYANNSEGAVVSTNVTFSVNTTKIVILYGEYRGSRKGRSTDFYNYSYEELQSLSNVIFENTLAGRVTFEQAINLTNDASPDDSLLDLDSNTNISYNRIEINSAALPNFNKLATIRLYGLNFSEPRILKNGEVCPSDTCAIKSYSSGILVFNVTNFTIYSAEETSEAAPSVPTGSGGGAGEKEDEFRLDKEKITVKLKQGETKSEEITITNTGFKRIKIDLAFSGLEEFTKINRASFELNPGESEKVILDFIARENTSPDLYLGKLIARSDNTEKEVLISMEVETKNPLFDVSLEIPEDSKVVEPGGEVLAKINLYNLGEIKRADVLIEYIIKDMEGNIITSEKETLAVETRVNFMRTIKIPEDVKYGTYILYIKVTYNGETAIASMEFSVGEVEKPFLTGENISIFIIILIIIVLIFLLVELKMLKKIYKRSRENKPAKPSLEDLDSEVQSI